MAGLACGDPLGRGFPFRPCLQPALQDARELVPAEGLGDPCEEGHGLRRRGGLLGCRGIGICKKIKWGALSGAGNTDRSLRSRMPWFCMSSSRREEEERSSSPPRFRSGSKCPFIRIEKHQAYDMGGVHTCE